MVFAFLCIWGSLMGTYKYKDYVLDIKKIGDERYRFLLEFDLQQDYSVKSALVLMQNPSKADEKISDQTINTVLDRLHRFGYTKVYIANLIPIYATDSRVISDMGLKEDLYERNDQIVAQVIEKATKIFVAWGGRNGFDKDLYAKRIKAIQNLLANKEVYCYKVNADGTPVHPARNQWKAEIVEDDFIKYGFKE